MTTLYFVGMTALSLVFYVPVNKLTPKLGKKKMILFAFAVFSLAYFYTGFMGNIPFIPEAVQGLILTVAAALPMAIFGILLQAVVADIAQSDAVTSGSSREGCFYERSKNFRLQAGAEPFHADLYGGLHHWKRQWSRIPDCGIRCSCILRRRRTDTDVLR